MPMNFSWSGSRQPKTGLLVHPEDRVNLSRGVIALPILLLPVVTGLPTGWFGVAYGLTIWFLLCDVNFLLHQHVHCRWTHSETVNRTLDIMLSCVTGMSAYNWREQHLIRHHGGDDSWGKAFGWEFRRASLIGAISYSLRGVPIVYFYPFWNAFARGILRHERWPFSYRAAFAEQVITGGVVWTLIFLEPVFYAPYYVLALFFTRLTDYNNHVGCDDAQELNFSNNTTAASYNWVRNNFGYHTAHHFYPDAHWTDLPTHHAEFAERLPPDRCGTKLWTGYFTPPLVFYTSIRLFRALYGRAT